jgi:DNA-binding LytR/AlgR family response regulator
MIQCIALDDEPMALEVIRAHCSKIPYVKLLNTFTQASSAQKYLMKFPVDLVFLDIQMPDINGITFYRNLQREAMVIFTTAYSDYAVEGFNVNAVDYLLKPVDFDRFLIACEKARDYADYLKSSGPEKQRCLYVRSEYALVKIQFAEILFLETMGDYIRIRRRNKGSVLTLMSMIKMMERLPANEFVRVHRSYIVPWDKIDSVRARTINIGSVEIPLGTRYEKEFLDRYKGQD